MTRYIEETPIISYIERLLNIGTGKKKSLEYLKKFVEHQPTADVVEVVHGKWLVAAFNKIMCSECKHIWNIMNNDVETFEHCPNCGAVMGRKKVE